eukprot:m.8636 g.8636  ORF g.8636 m.8636 type:complete len:450 (+) comp5381_c0_seq1:155-1504(+)
MSDEDFALDSDEDAEDYDFDYTSDEDAGGEEEVSLENVYYGGKALKATAPDKALAEFRKVIELETDKGEWGFRAHKQSLKVLFGQGKYAEMGPIYNDLLEYVKLRGVLTKNYSEKSINGILDYVSTATDPQLLQQFYTKTLETLKAAKNDRLWFKTNLKLGKMYLEQGELQALARTIRQLHKHHEEIKSADEHHGTQLMEIYALEIQMYTAQKDTKRLKELYELSLKIRSAIPHPFIMGIIRECGGKMHLEEEMWEAAYEDFFEAFRSYDESGSSKKIACLKYLVLANMLMKSQVDPFEAQESKPYKNNPEIVAMTDLVSAYQLNDINRFEAILKRHKASIMGDAFVASYIQDLLRNIRSAVLIRTVQPYTMVKLDFIARKLHITVEEVEDLLVACLLDGQITGQIDQLNQQLVLAPSSKSTANDRYAGISAWASSLERTVERLSAFQA